jgi:hypothetical protein
LIVDDTDLFRFVADEQQKWQHDTAFRVLAGSSERHVFSTLRDATAARIAAQTGAPLASLSLRFTIHHNLRVDTIRLKDGGEMPLMGFGTGGLTNDQVVRVCVFSRRTHFLLNFFSWKMRYIRP